MGGMARCSSASAVLMRPAIPAAAGKADPPSALAAILWDASKGVPLRSLMVQTLVTVGLVAGFGAMREGFKGPLFIQGDHVQVNAKKYGADADGELKALRALIEEELHAGFYNIDVDTSTLVDFLASAIRSTSAVVRCHTPAVPPCPPP